MTDTLNSTQAVIDALHQRFPQLRVVVDSADTTDGSHWFDLALGRFALTIEEHPARGFRLHFGHPTVFDFIRFGPGEVLSRDFDLLLVRLTELLEPYHG